MLVARAPSRSLVVKSAESPSLWTRGAPPTHAAVEYSRAQEPTYYRTIQTIKPKEEDRFNMKNEHTMDKPARAGRATQIAAMVITGLVAFIWVYFGRSYLIRDPDEWRIANQQLGYPLYIIPLIGVTTSLVAWAF